MSLSDFSKTLETPALRQVETHRGIRSGVVSDEHESANYKEIMGVRYLVGDVMLSPTNAVDQTVYTFAVTSFDDLNRFNNIPLWKLYTIRRYRVKMTVEVVSVFQHVGLLSIAWVDCPNVSNYQKDIYGLDVTQGGTCPHKLIIQLRDHILLKLGETRTYEIMSRWNSVHEAYFRTTGADGPFPYINHGTFVINTPVPYVAVAGVNPPQLRIWLQYVFDDATNTRIDAGVLPTF